MAFFKKAKKKEYDKAALPKHVAIIMDGQRALGKKALPPPHYGAPRRRGRAA